MQPMIVPKKFNQPPNGPNGISKPRPAQDGVNACQKEPAGWAGVVRCSLCPSPPQAKCCSQRHNECVHIRCAEQLGPASMRPSGPVFAWICCPSLPTGTTRRCLWPIGCKDLASSSFAVLVSTPRPSLCGLCGPERVGGVCFHIGLPPRGARRPRPVLTQLPRAERKVVCPCGRRGRLGAAA